MFAHMKHLAIVSHQYALIGRFYETVFGMKTSRSGRADRAVTVGDGYVGLNINPRKAGRQGGLDHFGFEVEDVETVFARVRENYPEVHILKRPATRPFAGLSMHDPAGNVFDLSQKDMTNRRDVYTEEGWDQERRVHHFALRTVIPEKLAQFYVDLFELKPVETPGRNSSFHLTDGRVTLVILPWKIQDYEGSGIERPALDHIGFRVESIEAVKERLESLDGTNPFLSPMPLGKGPEGEARLRLFSTCPYGKFHLADPDGVLIDISEG